MSTKKISIRTDAKLKQQAKDILEGMGLPLNTGVNIYFKKIIEIRAIPFELSLKSEPIKTTKQLKTEFVVEEELLAQLESVLKELNITVAIAYDMFLHFIVNEKKYPFIISQNLHPTKKPLGEARSQIKIGRPSNRDVVIKWQERHPNGSKTECRLDTGLSNDTIRKWWNS